MLPIEFEGSQWIGKPKDMTEEECSGIYVGRGIDNAGFPYFVTAWQPSKEDLEALNRGEQVWVKVIGGGLPPMWIYTVNEKGEANV